MTDIEKARRHYGDMIGLYETHRDADGTTYYKCWDEWDKYSVMITPAKQPGANYIAYKVAKDFDLDLYAKRVEDYGMAVEHLKPGEIPFVGRAIRFTLPNTTKMVLFADKEFVGKNVGTVDPDPWPDDVHGCGAMHLDHCLLMGQVDPAQGVNRVAESAEFCIKVLDFQLTERMLGGPEKNQLGLAFLSCSSKPHDLAFAGGQTSGFHHAAFYLDSWEDVRRAADVMGKHKTRIDIGPTRHGITRGATIYFFDPSGNRNETFAGLGYFVSKDMPIIDWSEENIGRAIFFPTGVLNETFTNEYTA
ncbi:MAG: catechol 2,3-dioxygenase, partial [Bradyrhizobium sp.]